ncbi:hypothetical protein K2173_025703 [Erythroxylum novogranatense]|uniref:Protein TIFY n=1 Tax=Erythroxylum novogranatense TaxID=1862640 RepID=A0AAV8SBT9_9ROSI|nr:hypothetical protein K2173_025703 [Erythroxylum novogranatense]
MPPPEYRASRSLLHKPLYQLTVDEVSQLTREDCRKYLKEKGMRRPSWNKSQALQQVFSLKTLLETPLDSDLPGARKRPYIRAPEISCASIKETSAQNPHNYLPAEVSVSTVHVHGDSPVGLAASNNDLESTRAKGTVVESGQLTIFYCGEVNVYDDVSRDKARAIMQLAAKPLLFPGQVETPGVKATPNPMLTFPIVPKGGPASRKALVQRYIEKRKDRFKTKRKMAIPSATGLDMYLNHMMRDGILIDQRNQKEEWSSPIPKLPQAPGRGSSVDNAANNFNHSTDLNVKEPRCFVVVITCISMQATGCQKTWMM